MTEYRLLRHPLVRRDIFRIGAHIEAVSGDPGSAERRMREIDVAFAGLLENPGSGVRLGGSLDGYCVRHAGRDNKISVVFHHDAAARRIFVVHVAFGGQNWLNAAATRVSYQ